MGLLQEKYKVYKAGFIDGVVGCPKITDYEACDHEEYRMGMQDGMEVVSKHLGYVRWKDDYNRRNEK